MKVLLWGLIPLMIACTNGNSKPIILKVGEVLVTSEEFSLRLVDEAKKYSAIHLKDSNKSSFIKQKVLDELLVESLLLSWAQREGLVVNDADVQAKLESLMANYPDEAAFKETYSSLKLQGDVLAKKLRVEVIKDKVLAQFKVEADVDEKELKAAYWGEKDSFTEPAKIYLQQIVVKNENEANLIYQALKKGSDFAKLARQYSLGAEAQQGGDLGWIEKGTLPAFDAAFKLPLKQVARPQKSSYGYHIFRVLKKQRKRKIPLAEVREQWANRSRQQQQTKLYQQWLEEQLHAVQIQRNEQAIANLILDVKGS